MTVNGKYYPRAERGLADAGEREIAAKACCVRLPGGGHCMLDDGHPGDHEATPPRYEHPMPEVDARIKARPRKKQLAPPADAAVTWPELGSRYRDDTGRVLTITAIDPKSVTERHITGTVDDASYACSRMVFDALWRAIV